MPTNNYSMLKIKTSELIDQALDCAVAKSIGIMHRDQYLGGHMMVGWWISGLHNDPNFWIRLDAFRPSTDWSQGGPIIERERIGVKAVHHGYAVSHWAATQEFVDGQCNGPTPLVAAMRCFCYSKFGDTVDIPPEFVQ